MINTRINRLRNLLNDFNIDAYIVPGTDPHQNEYIPEIWQRRKWITGFTGSYGNFALTVSESGLWTDSRYFIQAENELKNTEITLFKINTADTPDIKTWLFSKLKPGSKVGIDPRLISYSHSVEIEKYFSKNKLQAIWLEKNLIDIIWENKPGLSESPIEIHSLKYSGKSTENKISETRKMILLKKADIHIISNLDSIAWLFNLRGNDIEFNPLFISYAVIGHDKVSIFVRKSIVSEKTEEYLNKFSYICNYKDFKKHLSIISGKKILIDPLRTSKWITDLVSKNNQLILKESPVIPLKAVKNSAEAEGFVNSHIRDGTAMVKFLFWLNNNLPVKKITEISASSKLEEFRARQSYFKGLSFNTISAYKEHGAIVHYSANENTDIPLSKNSLYLLDSGAQYLDGTTDITRTISLGKPSNEEVFYYTSVLKCHIFLADSVFPKGTKGVQLDALARKFLWDIGEDYGHGTGHGVGSYLNVHETPPRISSLSPQYEYSLEENMFLSIEPGIYKKDKFGIRIENLFIIIRDKNLSKNEKVFLRFKPVTLCPFDLSLIDKNMLCLREIEYINNYHNAVYNLLKDNLNDDEKEWLVKSTKNI